MKAVVLVGGEGTRLRPLTETIPKPLVPLVDRPFLHQVLDHLGAHGVHEVILSSSYLEASFEAFLAERHGDPAVAWITEASPLGTAGAIANAAARLDETFLVLNGDILVDLDFQRLVERHAERKASATLALVRVPDPSAFGLVPVDGDGRVAAFLEKPGADEDRWVTDLINAGVYVLEPSVLDHVPPGRPSSFERDLFPRLLASGAPVYGYELHGYWRDLGTPIAYLQAQADLLEGRLHLPINATERRRNQYVADNAEIADGAVLRGPVMVGAGVRIEDEARVFGPSVLGPGSVVSGGARLERSVLLENARLESGAKVSDSIVGSEVIVGSGAVVGDGTILGDRVVIEGGNVLAGGLRVAPGVHLGPGAIRV